MKRSIVIAALILFFNLNLKSQDYFPFPTENVNWNIYLITACDESSPDTLILRYSIDGDTIINEVQYKTLWLESGDILYPKVNAVGGIRESEKKVYFIGQDFLGGFHDEEMLLYDFSKQIGDTIRHDTHGYFFSVVEDIDSMLINGQYRKRYLVDNNWFYHNPDYIVEGIGSIQNGLLGHITDIPTCGFHYWEHICFKEDDIVKYLNPAFSDCFTRILSVDKNPLQLYDIKIYPNPVGEVLHVENNTKLKELGIKVIDLNGRVVLEKRLEEGKKTIEFNAASGAYSVLLIDKHGSVLLVKNIIKQ